MVSMKEWLKKIFLSYFFIVTGSMFTATIMNALFYKEKSISLSAMGQIFSVSLITAFSSFIFYSKKELSKKEMLLRKIIHLFVLFAILLGSAFYFQWIELGEKTLSITVFFILMVTLIYFSVCFVFYQADIKMAKKLNKRLKEQFSEEEN